MSQPSHPFAEPSHDHVIAGRYRLIKRLGQGAFGDVWHAQDLILGEQVAVKRILQQGPESPQTRREIATLRLLRIPGVVRLFDEGEEDGNTFFVMEHVVGAPFPGLSPTLRLDLTDTINPLGNTAPPETPALSHTLGSSVASNAAQLNTPSHPSQPSNVWPWASLAAVTETLLETLQRVHAAGIVHRDLKPANVLVRDDGRPVLVDFGLCLPTTEGARLPTYGGGIQGTPAYLAPEQARGGPIDARADLYAVGVMLYEALTGCLPHDASNLAALLLVRATQRAIPIRTRVASIPPAIATLIDQLLAPSPTERPQSAQEVLTALRYSDPGTSTLARKEEQRFRLPDGEGPWDETQLVVVFSGRDRLFHLRQDAARVLAERTQGERQRVKDELSSWLALGIARPDGEGLRVDRDTLDRFDAGFPVASAKGRHLSLVASGQDALAAEEALERARAFAAQGRLGLASATLEEGLAAAHRARSTSASVETALLAAWVKVAFAEQRSQALDRVLYEVCRARQRSLPEVVRMEGLLRAAISVRTFFSAEPAAMAAALGAFDDPELERWRYWLRVRSCMYVDLAAAEAVVEEAAAWSTRVGVLSARAGVAGFRGILAYVRGQFKEAARFHAESAEHEPWLTLQIAQMLNEAVAHLEAFEPLRAQEVAGTAAALAARCRHPHFEGRAAWTTRTAAHRAGALMQPDLELLDALLDLGASDTLGAVYLTEAALAFRNGDHATAAALATHAATTWQRAGQRYAAMLARAFAGAMGASLPPNEAENLQTLAAECPLPGVGIQALAMLQKACPTLPSLPAEVLGSLCAQVPVDCWHHRMDVFSVDEARAILAGTT